MSLKLLMDLKLCGNDRQAIAAIKLFDPHCLLLWFFFIFPSDSLDELEFRSVSKHCALELHVHREKNVFL
jgi:hypothetical protein